MSCRFRAVWLLSLACLVAPGVWADDDDTRFLQDQTRRTIEQKAQAEEALAAPPGTLMYEGRRYQVPSTLEALTPAIYVAINTNQWTQLPDFIARYRELPGHRPALANMAESLLARFEGNYPLALQRMELASEQEPRDARILLELARLWFEDYQEKRAREGFARALEAGLPPEVQMLIQQYHLAMEIRADWHGSAALGWGYNDNINQANGHYSCLSEFAGICFFERRMPEAIDSEMVNYELSLQRRFNLSGNHNLQLRPLSYGNYYSTTDPSTTSRIKDYSNNLAILQAGYQYLDARDNISLAPYVEHYYRNRASDYLAHGLQLEWSHSLNRQWQLGTSLDAKRYEYSSQGLLTGADYDQYQWNLFASFSPSTRTSLYGGVSLTRKKYEVDQASSRDWAVRGGVYHLFAGSAGLFVNALGIYRESRNDAYDFFLGERRYDKQQVYILSAGVNAWQVAGLVPELRVRHSINHSNLDWAFGFEQTEVSLMLRKSF
ncbi:surface lipoprotein assembly modifier [Stutzerimonas nitrititolerans]|uniref:surface lipoprotein assembly modifier n=1 Tax=Stutzerimonas nitrititolerans TaxID=2482751 RepID=UPI0028985A5F|nr:surface lipoprotein assembly modifier [Stutzerimonas nitrititolerans]